MLKLKVTPLSKFDAMTCLHDHLSGPSYVGFFESKLEQKQQHLLVQSALAVYAKDFKLYFDALTPLGETLLLAVTGHKAKQVTLPLTPMDSSSAEDERERLLNNTTFDSIQKLLELMPSDPSLPGLGLLGVTSFESIQYYEPVKIPHFDPLQYPDFLFLFPEQFYYCLENKAYFLTVSDPSLPQAPTHEPKTANPITPHVASAVVCNTQDEAYQQQVKLLQQHIKAGDIFQAVLARRFSFTLQDPFAAFETIKNNNATPYAFYLKTPTHTLFGASPETSVLIQAHAKGRSITLSPLAGTREILSHQNKADLAAVEQELLQDPKEMAEHMMLVDLARNDLARICQPGTRQIHALAHTKAFTHVMHIRSTLEGLLDPKVHAFHALLACSPMGTLSGAPKLKAIELIQSLEQERRGPYGGSIGIFRKDKTLDTAIIIRSLIHTQGQAHVTCGAGIVKKSVPELESKETTIKANSLFKPLFNRKESSL